MHELDIKSPNLDITLTERDSLSILKQFIVKQEELLGFQEAHFRAATDHIIQELKMADRGINESQQEIGSLRAQTRTMLAEIRATIK